MSSDKVNVFVSNAVITKQPSSLRCIKGHPTGWPGKLLGQRGGKLHTFQTQGATDGAANGSTYSATNRSANGSANGATHSATNGTRNRVHFALKFHNYVPIRCFEVESLRPITKTIRLHPDSKPVTKAWKKPTRALCLAVPNDSRN